MKNINKYICAVFLIIYSADIFSENVKLNFNVQKELKSITLLNKRIEVPISGSWSLEGCELISQDIKTKNDVVFLNKKWKYKETYFTSKEEIRCFDNRVKWIFTVIDKNKKYWSVPIKTTFKYPNSSDTRYWSAWSDSRQGKILNLSKEQQIKKGIIPDAITVNDWADPYIAIPLQKAKLWYGEEPYSLDTKWRMFGVRNDDKNIVVIPMITLIEPNKNIGITYLQSLDDKLLNVNIETSEDGKIIFRRENYRLGKSVKQSFTVDILIHEDDYLQGFNEITKLYSEYFVPSNDKVREMDGMFSYSRDWGNFDKNEYHEMGYKVNWKASHDFPWMGLFIPYLKDNVCWKGFERNKKCKDDTVSISKIRNYIDDMTKSGFKVLNYMNVCEFGAYVSTEAPKDMNTIPKKDLWKNSSAFIYRNMSDAILRRTYRNPKEGQSDKFYSWRKCIALDCGVKCYKDFLIDQVKRHIDKFPSSSGFNVDRLDWLRLYNPDTDDGISYWENQPVGSLNMSYKKLMDKLWPILKKNNKYWFLDPNGVRIDFMNRADGIMAEINEGQNLNCATFLAPMKPMSAWMHIKNMENKSQEEREVWLQTFLYLGIWPMAPFPENDHSLLPNEEIEKLYLDYAPLFKTLYGRENILSSKAIKRDSQSKVNIFKSDLGYTIPIVFASKGTDNVEININRKYIENKKLYVYHIGCKNPQIISYKIKGEYAQINVPLVRRCAVLVSK